MTLELDKPRKKQQTKQGTVNLKNMPPRDHPKFPYTLPSFMGQTPGNPPPAKKTQGARIHPPGSRAKWRVWRLLVPLSPWRWMAARQMAPWLGVVGYRGGGRVAMGLRLGFGVVTLLRGGGCFWFSASAFFWGDEDDGCCFSRSWGGGAWSW